MGATSRSDIGHPQQWDSVIAEVQRAGTAPLDTGTAGPGEGPQLSVRFQPKGDQ